MPTLAREISSESMAIECACPIAEKAVGIDVRVMAGEVV